MHSVTSVIDISLDCPRWAEAVPGPEALCRRAADRALGAMSPAAGAVEVSIVLSDDAAVARLNREFRGHDGPTNVLAFPNAEAAGAVTGPDAPPVLLGDVIVAYETVAAEAGASGTPIADHLAHLVVHGMLHLLGYDHADEPGARRMEALETELLAALGVADPYGEEQATLA